jgi:hypothetical protein
MSNKLKMLAIAAALAAGTSSVAMAQVCPAGYSWYAGACQPMAAPAPYAYAPSNPVSGAVNGEMSGAAAGAATAGPVGASSTRSAATSTIAYRQYGLAPGGDLAAAFHRVPKSASGL